MRLLTRRACVVTHQLTAGQRCRQCIDKCQLRQLLRFAVNSRNIEMLAHARAKCNFYEKKFYILI